MSVQPLHAKNVTTTFDIHVFFKCLFGINIHSAEDGSDVKTTTTTAGCTTQKDFYIPVICYVVGVNLSYHIL